MRSALLFFNLFLSLFLSAQTFSGTGAPIPDDGNSIVFEISVSGLPAVMDTQSFGIEQVCVNIVHTWGADLSLTLIAPDGNSTTLFSGIGGDTDGFQDACLNGNATTSIYQGSYPYTGTFRPLGDMGTLNNGQNPNGIWKLLILDTYPFADAGDLNSWSITFGNDPSKRFPFFSSDLPIVRINTDGKPISDNPKTDGIIELIDNGPGVRNYPDQTITAFSGPMGIEFHGNSSQGFPKKSYRFELRDEAGEDLDVSLLGMGSTSDYVLSAQFSDKTLMRNALTYDLSRQLGQYASRTRFCEVLLNGTYQGVYVLTERIKRGEDLVDISKLKDTDIAGVEMTGGYIIKIDWNTTPGWNSQFSQPNNPDIFPYFQYEYPRWDRLQPEQALYIRNYVDSFEVALKSSLYQHPVNGWRRFADEKSFLDFMILNELSKNVDGYRLSTYFHKDRDDKGGKIKMGPTWDFDLGWLNADYCDAFNPNGWAYNLNYVCGDAGVPFWWERLMADPKFRQNLNCRWNLLRSTILHLDNIHAMIDSMALVVNESQERNFKQWPILGTYVWPNPGNLPNTYEGEVNKLKGWVNERIVWLDDIINLYAPSVNANFTTADNGAFNWTFTPANVNTGYIYQWDFGDGTTDSLSNAVHTYQSGGTFTVTLTVRTPFGCSESTQQVIQISTSGAASVIEQPLQIFPNPADDKVIIRIPGGEPFDVVFYNTLGQKVLQQEMVQHAVDVSGLPEGVYQVVANSAGKRWIGQVMVKE